jgi:uncharacterized protein YndB with AHSA1/START domain
MNQIEVQTLLSASPEAVWEAITQIEKMRKWYFENIPDFKPQVGFTTQFPVESETRIFTHVWEVTKVIPQKQICYNWSYAEYEGKANVCFVLEPVDGGTKLTLAFDGIETFPNDVPEFTEESCRAGWEYFLGESLPNYLEYN